MGSATLATLLYQQYSCRYESGTSSYSQKRGEAETTGT